MSIHYILINLCRVQWKEVAPSKEMVEIRCFDYVQISNIRK